MKKEVKKKNDGKPKRSTKVRLWQPAVMCGYRRGQRNQNPHVSLLAIKVATTLPRVFVFFRTWRCGVDECLVILMVSLHSQSWQRICLGHSGGGTAFVSGRQNSKRNLLLHGKASRVHV